MNTGGLRIVKGFNGLGKWDKISNLFRGDGFGMVNYMIWSAAMFETATARTMEALGMNIGPRNDNPAVIEAVAPVAEPWQVARKAPEGINSMSNHADKFVYALVEEIKLCNQTGNQLDVALEWETKSTGSRLRAVRFWRSNDPKHEREPKMVFADSLCSYWRMSREDLDGKLLSPSYWNNLTQIGDVPINKGVVNWISRSFKEGQEEHFDKYARVNLGYFPDKLKSGEDENVLKLHQVLAERIKQGKKTTIGLFIDANEVVKLGLIEGTGDEIMSTSPDRLKFVEINPDGATPLRKEFIVGSENMIKLMNLWGAALPMSIGGNTDEKKMCGRWKQISQIKHQDGNFYSSVRATRDGYVIDRLVGARIIRNDS